MDAAEKERLEQGSRYLSMRIQSSSQIVMVLAAGIFMPMAIEHSNKRQRAMHLPTMLCAFLTIFCGLALRGLVGECCFRIPGPRRYIAIKSLVHACALLLVSLSLMMRMNVIAYQLWQCAKMKLSDDVDAYWDCEEQLQQLLDLSTGVTSILFGGWYGMAFFYFQNYPEEARDARFVPSEYLAFFTSAAASLMVVKAVPRRRPPCPRSMREMKALACALVCGVMATALVIAASKVGGYALLALVPEAIAFAAWCTQKADEAHALPVSWPECLGHGHHGGDHAEPPSHNFVSVSLTLLLAVLTYRAKDARAMSSVYDEAFVLVTAAAVVAALGWRLLTQPPTPIQAPEVQVAAKILAFSTFWLLLLSVLAFLGVMFGW